MLALFVLRKLWRRISSNKAAAEEPSGVGVAVELEALSGLRLDRAPPEPTDEERRADRNPIQIAAGWLNERLRSTESPRTSAHELRRFQNRDPHVGVVRQRTA